MEPFKLRVLKEAEDLEDRCGALNAFLTTKYFSQELPAQEQELLIAQHHAMRVYLHILNQRIALF